jgi:hypothetical protein|tara:strand:- start:316 stop:423 length:108 start_codon:yes stop_codon:yes gene_type:complete
MGSRFYTKRQRVRAEKKDHKRGDRVRPKTKVKQVQ